MLRIFLLFAVQASLVMGEFGGYYLAGHWEDEEKDPPRYWLDDPEPRDIDLETKYVEDFKKKVPGENRQIGDLYAGRAEFPWIVNVRFGLVHDDAELFATGNIISRHRVLSVCRIVLYANGYRTQTGQESKAAEVIELSSVHGLRYSMGLFEEKIELNVIYCANFLWVKYPSLLASKGDHNYELSYEGGEAKVRFISAHPKCEIDALVYDFAILSLASDIIPVPPTLTYIPIQLDKALEDIAAFDLTKTTEERKLCFVASFGYTYINSPNPKTMDYKVKYRAYYASWDLCSKLWDLLGTPSQEGIEKPYWCPQHDKTCVLDETIRFHLLCFNTRARIGSVCDHDRGSPLVCDNQVYGFVTRGVEFKYCSSQMHVPFIIVKLTAIPEYFKQSALDKYRVKRNHDRDILVPWLDSLSLASSTKFTPVLLTGMLFKLIMESFLLPLYH